MAIGIFFWLPNMCQYFLLNPRIAKPGCCTEDSLTPCMRNQTLSDISVYTQAMDASLCCLLFKPKWWMHACIFKVQIASIYLLTIGPNSSGPQAAYFWVDAQYWKRPWTMNHVITLWTMKWPYAYDLWTVWCLSCWVVTLCIWPMECVVSLSFPW